MNTKAHTREGGDSPGELSATEKALIRALVAAIVRELAAVNSLNSGAA